MCSRVHAPPHRQAKESPKSFPQDDVWSKFRAVGEGTKQDCAAQLRVHAGYPLTELLPVFQIVVSSGISK